jgi:putative tricarboxylic transport membrane protein
MFDKKDFSSGLFFFGLGLFMAFRSIQHSVWSKLGPDEGFFPLCIALIIIGVSLIIITGSFISARLRKKERKSEAQEEKVFNVFKVSSYAVLMLLYAVLFGSVGFLITSALFLVLILKYVERQGWKITILLGLSSVIISYVLFVYFLGVFLPKGLISW